MKYVVLAFFLLLVVPGMAQAKDTIVVNAIALDGGTVRIGDNVMKIAGIDAPDLSQKCIVAYQEYNCGRRSRDMLQKITTLDKLTCIEVGADDKGHKLANCSVGQDDLGTLMIQSGWAVPLSTTPAPTYANAQETARQNGRGMWQGQFAKPSEWRAGNMFPANSGQ